MIDRSRESWSIEELDAGWCLNVQYRIPLEEYRPHWPQWLRRTFWLAPILIYMGISAIIPARSLDPVGLAVIYLIYLVAAWFSGSLGRGGTEMQLGIAGANRMMSIPVSNGRIDTADGVFDITHLSTLRVEPGGDVIGDRARLVFSGAVNDSDLVGWPGVSVELAEEMAAAILRRVSGDDATPVGANKGINLTAI